MRAALLPFAVLVLCRGVSAGEPPREASSERARQLSACAGCHPDAYANWAKGPHASSFHSLEKYRESVLGRPELHPPDLVRSFEPGVPEECRGCHAPAALFGSVVASAAEGSARVSWASVPPARPADSAATGVDCLTCHVDELGRIRKASGAPTPSGSHATDAPASSGAGCRPVASPALADQTFCFVCHSDTAKQYLQVKYVLPRDVRAQMDARGCGSCHQEYGEDGRSTHYTFWKDGPPSKRESFRTVFDRVRVSLERRSGASFARAELVNDFAPHEFPSQSLPEFAVHVEVRTAKGQAASSAMFRLNRKSEEDRKSRERGEAEKIPGGVVGKILMPFEPGASVEVPIRESSLGSGCEVAISVRYKSQYWLPDAQARQVYERTEPCPGARPQERD